MELTAFTALVPPNSQELHPPACRSSDPHPGLIAARVRLRGSALVAAAVAFVTACGDEPMTLATPDPSVPTTVAISPASAAFRSISDTVRMIATVSDQYGSAMADVAVVWNSGNIAVAAVTEGLVTAMGNGNATVTAVAGSAVASAKVAVEQLANTVIVTPATDSVAEGDTLRLSAVAMDGNGHVVTGAEFEWSSDNGSVAGVTKFGLVHAAAEGTATISVVSGSAQDAAHITVFHPDRAVLVALYEAMDGPNWVNSENWLTDAPLWDWYGISLRGGRVAMLNLRKNGLTGSIPPELVGLSGLRWLLLDENALSGPIPSELAGLTDLRWLWLDGNALTGPVPPKLGDTSLESLGLSDNELSGPIPPELGKNQNLTDLSVANNPGLRGEIPPAILPNLEKLYSYGTGLCVARTGDFDSYITRDHWIGYACGETEPGFQIQLVFEPDVPEFIRDAMNSQAEYWMEILRETEAPDIFGTADCHGVGRMQQVPVIDDVLVVVSMWKTYTAGICGSYRMLRHRIPDRGGVAFERNWLDIDSRWVDLVARHALGHVLGIGTLWDIRGQLKNPSTSKEVRDTYVVSPLAERAFDAAGGASYTGPKVPLRHRRNYTSHWRPEVFGSELMTGRWSDHVPTSAVTLQALADLGYTVDLSLADPYTLPGAAAASAIGTAASLSFELGWEGPSSVVVCPPRDRPFEEPEALGFRDLAAPVSVQTLCTSIRWTRGRF